MSWLFSRALVEECLEPTISELNQSALSSGSYTADVYWLSDKTTDSYPRSQYGMTFGRLTPDVGAESLISSAEAFLAKHSAEQLEGETMPMIFGLKCCESWQMSLPGTYTRKTSATWPSAQRPKTLKHLATKPACFPFPRQTWVRITFGSAIGYLHTPTTKANYAASSMQKWPAARAFVAVFGRPTPESHEWLMGWPPGWSDTRPLEMGKYLRWQQQLCGHLQMLIEPPNSGDEK